MSNPIPIIDLFAGPGGLGEGFSAFSTPETASPFCIKLSIEKDYYAHRTLQLRSFYRKFPKGLVPEDYYQYLRCDLDFTALERRFPAETGKAEKEAWLAELGKEDQKTIDHRIEAALEGNKQWVLIGGPPCQAYSLAGRSRNQGTNPEDERLYLYREYLRIIADHSPVVFVMENVKGLLSSRINNELIFEKILSDLRSPVAAINENSSPAEHEYELFSLVKQSSTISGNNTAIDPKEFVIKAEEYGIPQARHRVIIFGVRKDSIKIKNNVLNPSDAVCVKQVLSGLPPLRSGLSKEKDSDESWKKSLQKILKSRWLSENKGEYDDLVYAKIREVINNLTENVKGRGADYISEWSATIDYKKEWFLDKRLKGVCNHSSRGHIAEDLHRYLFAICYAEIHGQSPTLQSFPVELLPDHRNVLKALRGGHFEDRFRVQVENRPSTTITSHIAKDGHYYIHPDPLQCRSLTVREAARLQTFPDNYFFEGPRTEQYKQVGNAVPPLLARQIAEIVYNLIH